MQNEEIKERYNAAVCVLTDCLNMIELAAENKNLKESLEDMTLLYQDADDRVTDLTAICIANGWNPDYDVIGKSE